MLVTKLFVSVQTLFDYDVHDLDINYISLFSPLRICVTFSAPLHIVSTTFVQNITIDEVALSDVCGCDLAP